jgi:hypothetical protein
MKLAISFCPFCTWPTLWPWMFRQHVPQKYWAASELHGVSNPENSIFWYSYFLDIMNHPVLSVFKNVSVTEASSHFRLPLITILKWRHRLESLVIDRTVLEYTLKKYVGRGLTSFICLKAGYSIRHLWVHYWTVIKCRQFVNSVPISLSRSSPHGDIRYEFIYFV